MRGALLVLTAVLVCIAVTPAGAAQTSPRIFIHLGFEKEFLELPASGRDSIGAWAKVHTEGFVCLNEAQLVVPIRLAPFEKWAGASLEPSYFVWALTFPRGQPDQIGRFSGLNVAWDVESAPRVDAQQRYAMTVEGARLEGGPCMPSPRTEAAQRPTVVVSLPDREDAWAAEGEPCLVEPTVHFTAEGRSSLEPEAFVSAPPAAPGLVLLAALAALRRRR